MTKSIVSIFVLCVLVATPLTGHAAVNSPIYNSMTNSEKIAYLYGMVAQLQMLLELQLENANSNSNNYGRNLADIDIETRPATNIRDDEAQLRADIDLNREDEARVWFEYGEDDDDLDDRTSARRVTDSRGDRQTVSITIDDLDEDERYYFRAVAEDEDGDRSYGRIRNFTTEDDWRSDSSDTDDYELDISDRLIDDGDSVSVDWEIPRDQADTQNWIGLYEVGRDNRTFVEWVYIENDDQGTERFTIDDEGEYEFRLFLDNNYTDVAVSRVVEVR